MESTQATAHAHPNTVALQACLREAIAEGPRLFKQWLNGLGEELHAKEKSVSSFRERTELINSQNQISRLRPELEKKWAVCWEKAIENGLKGQQTPSQTRRSLSQIRFEELELMGDDQIQATVEIARIQQAVQIIADQALNDLTARLSRAQGSSVVKASQNPLGPEVVVQVLTQTLDTVCPDKATRTLWLQHGSKLMGQELTELYLHLSRLLDEQGVTPAQYGAVQTAGGGSFSGGPGLRPVAPGGAVAVPVPGAAPAGYAGSPSGNDAWGGTGHGMLPQHYGGLRAATPVAPSLPVGSLPPSSLLTLNHLHQLLVSENAIALLNSQGETGQAELNIQGVEGNVNDAVPLPTLIITDPNVLAAHPTDGTARPTYHGNERRKRPRGVQALDGDALGQLSLRELAEEVVGLMLDGIAQDQRLLAPISSTLKSLRPALLKVASQNPRFFADRANPARRLLDELTQRSLAYSSTDSEGFDFFIHRLQEAVHSLSGDELDTNQLALNFEKALYILDSPADTVPQVLEAQEAEQDKAVASLLKAEQRYLIAEKIAQKIQARNDFGLVPHEVQQFITGPWSQVIALAQMQPSPDSKQEDGRTAAQAYLDLTSDLLWSCHPELASRNRARLARVIPGLLRKLRQGLASIGYPQEQSAPFFNVLMRSHEAALRASTNANSNDGEATDPSSPTPSARAPLPAEAPTASAGDEYDSTPAPGPWLSPTEVADARMLDVADSQPDFAQTEPMEYSSYGAAWAAAEAPVADMLPKDDFLDLSLGAWIELEQVAGERQRARLKWASPHGNMYLFIRTDGKSISMTRRMYQSLVTQQRLRLVADQSVVDDALDGVMAMAVRNSTKN
ncbi:MAG: hypothetical protein RLZZ612_2568 [Pseudomonadota bacterium]|jgi:hypothetical protein